jgi:4-hydroxythreonine-4-phosphate dehydrogenase
MAALPVIAISIGDPAGIGPELALKAAASAAVRARCRPLLFGSGALLARVAERLQLGAPAALSEVAVPGLRAAAVRPGLVSARCGAAAAAYVEAGIAACLDGRAEALVTCPINKAALHAAGVPYPGHTELLAARCGVRGEAMMMYHRRLAVVLATSHQPLASVSGALRSGRIVAVGQLFAAALSRLRRGPVRLAVCGFNPHAGEGGLFGSEDQRVVAPAVARLRMLGIDAEGPLPPDTAFTPANRRRYSGHLCLYHDQGLIPFKALAFDEGVNVTLGLPIIRTSVDHGTAFDIAWQGVADHRSLVAAILLALRLAAQRRASPAATPRSGSAPAGRARRG